MIKVKDIMTKNVFVLYANETLEIVRSLMEIKHVRHVPIVDTKGRFVGLITHRDLLAMTVSRLAGIDENVQDDLDRHIPISKVMQKKIITADPEMDVRKAISLLLRNKVGCLPVVLRKKLVGIVTEADFLAFTYNLLKKEKKI
ncbi:MAG TPA: CBS domain-containing protein [Thermodesulfobacteriota bacterium]|nr:CBS domain-containing protein [Thermodesulfobacteriota bacterium]